jgi:hypothetical protein
MTFATFANLIVSILCAAVVWQSMRMARGIREMKSGDLGETVKALDRATAEARGVLGELKSVLSIDGAANVRTIASGETLRDELSLMVGIGNAVADRIIEAAAAGERKKDEVAQAARKQMEEPRPGLVAKPRRKRGAGPHNSRDGVTAPAHTRLQ